MSRKPYRILSLDGGGSWALIQAKALGAIYGAETDGWSILNRFDYAAKIPGIEVVDRYTLRLRLEKPDYSFLYILAMSTIGAQAREERHLFGADLTGHPAA